jgi:hypothetical protein
MVPVLADTPLFSTSERARAPRTEFGRRTIPPDPKEGTTNPPPHEDLCTYYHSHLAGRSRRLTSHGKRGTKWERTGDFNFPEIIGFRLGYSNEQGRHTGCLVSAGSLRLFYLAEEELIRKKLTKPTLMKKKTCRIYHDALSCIYTSRTELGSFLYSNLLKDSSIYRAVVLTSLTHSLPVNPNPNPAAQSRVERVCSFLDNREGGPWIVCVI